MPEYAVTDDPVSMSDGLAFDEIIEKGLALCAALPAEPKYEPFRRRIADLSERLAGGRMHLAVLGQFNRGKSTFVNALLGMPLLPVSVLPITSIPTIISYGSRLSCTVEFSCRADPERASDSPESIMRLLMRYVAEQNNPKNRDDVSRVTVTCESPILRHGTVLIDTPGFGSTHVHNTQTTRTLVEGCDAALFLLSADLPITQVEVEFLEEVRKYVPRIFFIYNKADILTEEELTITIDYIRSVLAQSHFSAEAPVIFPISARKGQMAQEHSDDNGDWRDSGMEKIKTEVIDFLLKEKYFALSEALSGKYKSALESIIGLLRDDRAGCLAPAEKLAHERDRISAYAASVDKEASAQISEAAYDEKKLGQFLAQRLGEEKEKLLHKLEADLEPLLAAASASSAPLPILQASLQKLLCEVFGNAYLRIGGAINSRLQDCIESYGEKLAAQARRICADMGEAPDAVTGDLKRSPEMLFDTQGRWEPPLSFELPFLSTPRQLLARIQTKTARLNYYRKSLSPALAEYAVTCHQHLLHAMNNRLRSCCAQCSDALGHGYAQLVEFIRLKLFDMDTQLQNLHDSRHAYIAHIESLSRDFERIQQALR